MVSAARKRAQRDGIPFDLRFTDFVIPVTCPITQRPFAIASGSPGDDSPTLDKIIPERGYVRGNIAVISHRANRIKSDADLPTIQRLLRWLTDSVHIISTFDKAALGERTGLAADDQVSGGLR